MGKIILRKNEEHRIKAGHQWVFSNEIGQVQGEVANGDLVKIYNSKNMMVGQGFYNKNSLIAVRLLARDFDGEVEAYIKDKILKAYSLRRQFYPNRDSFRLVFSESDFLPGLIIDKYNNTFVLQIYSAAIERYIETIVSVLKEDFDAENIFTMNEQSIRVLEGLPEINEVYLGSIGEETIDDGKLKYKIKFATAQKTGFFFDQCDNREFTERISEDSSVLDVFCYSGGFGMHAASAGAYSVTFVDSSEDAIEQAKSNFKLNKLKCESEFVSSDAFDYLEKSIALSKTYDVVIIDPPAFSKTKKGLPVAIQGYIKLNKFAIQLVKNGGYLVTSSCSHHLKKKDFVNIMNVASDKTNRNTQIVTYTGAALDHPQIPAMDETSYLKFAILKITHP